MDIVYYVAASLDGFIATPNGGIDWLASVESPETDYGYAEFYAGIDAVLLGRRTCEQALGFDAWPYPDRPAWVFSRREQETPVDGVTVTAASPGEVAAELAARGVRRAWLVGGAALAASFRDERLISEYVVSVIPMLLGGGIPLLAPGGAAEELRLIETQSYPTGVVQLRYRATPRDQ